MTTGFNNNGNAVPSRVIFNSGTIDFGNNRMVALDSVSLGIEWTMNPLYVVGSIVPQAYNRSSQKITLSGKMKSFPAELAAVALGSSAIGSPNNINPLDGQPTLLSPVATLYDANNKEYQYQFTGAIFKTFKTNVKMEDYAEFDFELEASGLTLVYTQ